MENLKEKIKDIVSGNGNENINNKSEELKQRGEKLKEERLLLNRKIKELQDKKLQQVSDFQRLEEEINLKKKENLIADIISKKRFQVETRNDLLKEESQEILLLTKLELIQQEKKIRQQNLEKEKDMTLEKYDSSIKLVKNEPDLQEKIKELVEKQNTDDLETTITRELQTSLKKSYLGQYEKTMTERKLLIKEKYEIEAHLQTLQNQLSETNQNITFPHEDIFQKAKDIDSIVKNNISQNESRISNVINELDWLQSHPSSEIWKVLTSRISNIISKNESDNNDIEFSRIFLLTQKKEYKPRDELEEEDIQNFSNIILVELVDEVMPQILKEVVEGFINLKNVIKSRIHSVISMSVCCVPQESETNTELTGKLHLLRGCLAGLSTRELAKDLSIKFIRSQSIINVNNIQSSKYFSQTQTNKKIELWKYSHEINPSKNILTSKTWENIELPNISNKPFLLPSEIKIVSIIRLFSRPNQNLSLLTIGSKTGRIGIWSILWNSTENEHPILIAMSPRLSIQEESPLIDIQEPNCPSNQLITMDEKGAIRVWILNPPSKHKNHTRHMFPSLFKDYHPIILSCAFYITPSELNLPKTHSLSFYLDSTPLETKFDYKSMIATQIGSYPQKVIFSPTFSFSMRQNSLLVGCFSGDIIKINLDFKEKYFASQIIQPPRFVNVEFMHSASIRQERDIPTSLLLASGDPTLKGNMIYRELFHHHKAPIIFLGVINFLLSKIISIDESGEIAVWEYHQKQLQPENWFIPIYTASMDLRWFEYQSLLVSAEFPLPPQTPHDTIKKHLKLIKCVILDEIWKEEYFLPITNVPQHRSDIEVLYKRKIKRNTQNEINLEEIWSAENVKSSFLSACVIKTAQSRDGSEVTFVVVYSTSSSSSTSNTTSNTTSNINTKQSSNLKSNVKPNLIALITLNLVNLEFHYPAATFEIERDELIIDVNIGPINLTKSSRLIFLTSNKKIRSFCFETGLLIQTWNFPLFHDKNLPNFTPMYITICPLQRILAYASPENRHFIVHRIIHPTIDENEKISEENDKENKNHKHSIAFGKLVKNLNYFILNKTFEVKFEISEELKNELNEIFDILIENTFKIIDNKIKKQRIEEIYGSNLGIVYPSNWPINEEQDNNINNNNNNNNHINNNNKEEEEYDDSDDSDDSISSVSSEYDSKSDEAESVSTESDNETQK